MYLEAVPEWRKLLPSKQTTLANFERFCRKKKTLAPENDAFVKQTGWHAEVSFFAGRGRFKIGSPHFNYIMFEVRSTFCRRKVCAWKAVRWGRQKMVSSILYWIHQDIKDMFKKDVYKFIISWILKYRANREGVTVVKWTSGGRTKKGVCKISASCSYLPKWQFLCLKLYEKKLCFVC